MTDVPEGWSINDAGNPIFCGGGEFLTISCGKPMPRVAFLALRKAIRDAETLAAVAEVVASVRNGVDDGPAFEVIAEIVEEAS